MSAFQRKYKLFVFQIMKVISWLSSLLQRSYHILLHSYLKVMRNALLAPFPPPVIHFLLHPYLKMMRNALLAPFPPSVFISYYILIKKWWEMLSSLPFLLQCSFLITFLFKNDEKCYHGSLLSSSVPSYYILIKNDEKCSAGPRSSPVSISYYILI